MISIVNNQDQFSKLFPKFKEQSKISSNPDLYLIGLDCEFSSKANNKESFNKVNWIDKTKCDTAICTIQIANQEQCIILNICEMKSLPNIFQEIMTSYNWIKTGVGLNGDIDFIKLNFGLENMISCIDLKLFGELCGIQNPSLKNMYETFGFGILNKNTSTFDWTKDLTLEQITYAGMDGFASFLLGQLFIKNMTQNIKGLIGSNKSIPLVKSNQIDTKPIITIDTKEQNYIGILQEFCQKNNYNLPEYTIEEYDVNVHPRKYICKCNFMRIVSENEDDYKETKSISTSKQTAKNECAKKMCQELYLI